MEFPFTKDFSRESGLWPIPKPLLVVERFNPTWAYIRAFFPLVSTYEQSGVPRTSSPFLIPTGRPENAGVNSKPIEFLNSNVPFAFPLEKGYS